MATQEMTGRVVPIATWMRRVHTEDREMPGLTLTVSQAGRLWGLDDITGEAVFSALVDAQILRRTHCGAYVRADFV